MSRIVSLLVLLLALGSASIFAFDIGNQVLVNWSGDEYWYFATIVQSEGNDYYVIYDDGDEEVTTVNHLRVSY